MVQNRTKMTLLFLVFFSTTGLLPAVADTVYAYKGNSFTSVTAPYTTSDFISGSFSTALPLPANQLTLEVPTESFSFSDGAQTITNTTPNISPVFTITTDASGKIISWVVALQNINGFGIITANTAGDESSAADGGSMSFESQGSNSASPGVWRSANSAVPEPASVGLIAAAMFLLTAARLRSLRGR